MNNRKNKIALAFGAVCGGFLAILVQKYSNLDVNYKTLIIAFLPWISAELFNFIYTRFIKR